MLGYEFFGFVGRNVGAAGRCPVRDLHIDRDPVDAAALGLESNTRLAAPHRSPWSSVMTSFTLRRPRSARGDRRNAA